MTEMFVSWFGHGLRFLANEILATIGWPGVVSLLAGSVLLLSLSARAMKFMFSRKGMALAAVLLVVALFFWGKDGNQAAPTPLKHEPVALRQEVTQPEDQPAALEAELEPPPAEEMEAELETKVAKVRQSLPGIPYIPPVEAPFLPLTPSSLTTFATPVVTHPSLAHGHASGHPATATHSMVAATPSSGGVAHSFASRPQGGVMGAGSTSSGFSPVHQPSDTSPQATPGQSVATAASSPVAQSRTPLARRQSQRSFSGGQMPSNGFGYGMGFTPDASHFTGQQAHQANGGMSRRQTIHQQNIIAGQMMDQIMGGMMPNPWHMGQTGGVHPDFGGMHPGTHTGGMGHSGGQGHMGGHH